MDSALSGTRVCGGEEYRNSCPLDSDPSVPALKWILENHGGSRLSNEDSWSLNIARGETHAIHNKLWNNTLSPGQIPLSDAILCPLHPSTAPPHGHAHYWNYTSHWNYIDLPAVVFPVRTVESSDLSQKLIEYRNPSENITKIILQRHTRMPQPTFN